MKITKSQKALAHLQEIKKTIDRLIISKEDFTAFVMIAIGIEFLGAILDSAPFSKKGESKKRFTRGVNTFGNNWYKNNQKALFEDFRGPLVHQLWIGDKFFLTSIGKNSARKQQHLKKINDKTILVVEVFFEDFQKAINGVKCSLGKKNSNFNKNKISEDYTTIWESDENIEFSGTTTTYFYLPPTNGNSPTSST